MLKFSEANAKTKALSVVEGIKGFLTNDRRIYSLDLLSGRNCPFAKECKSMAVEQPDGRVIIQDGPHTRFRCFSASQEVTYPRLYQMRKHNTDLLLMCDSTREMELLIAHSMPLNLGVCRIHVAGDFFNQDYFNAWVGIADFFKDKLFYAYTKSIPYWLNRWEEIPPNLVLTASMGGTLDDVVKVYHLRYAQVVFSEAEAMALGLEIDHDDSHAADPGKRYQNFALLVHGIQPKGSEASKAKAALKGKGAYHNASK